MSGYNTIGALKLCACNAHEELSQSGVESRTARTGRICASQSKQCGSIWMEKWTFKTLASQSSSIANRFVCVQDKSLSFLVLKFLLCEWQCLQDPFQHLMAYNTPTCLKTAVGKGIVKKKTKTNDCGNIITKIILETKYFFLSLFRLRLHFNDGSKK